MNFLDLYKKNNLIAAHRGARSVSPENTLSALKMAVGHCDFLEVDVQLSSDEVCVIMHDDSLERTTNISKIEKFNTRKPYNVWDFSFKELKELDYGSWFDQKFEPLLTFEDTLKFVRENDLFINVEIKDISVAFDDKKVVDKVIGMIQNFNLNDRVLISSFRHEYLPLCQQLAPDIPTAALVEYEHPKDLINYLKKLNVVAYNPDDELVTESLIKELKQAGFYTNVWTVNDKARQKELFEMGVNGIYTDYVR